MSVSLGLCDGTSLAQVDDLLVGLFKLTIKGVNLQVVDDTEPDSFLLGVHDRQHRVINDVLFGQAERVVVNGMVE